MNEVCVELQDVSKRFGSIAAVEHVLLQIYRGEFFSLLGPSGCGKTTLLRLIAGFEEPTAGKILINGKDVTGVPPHRRPVNTVFQHYSLFPHMNVAQNIAFGLQQKRVPESEINRRVAEALELVRLPGYEKRRPSELSGGQKQRVALARALVLHPDVLLLDEPLGALDLKLRREMQIELKNLQEQLHITFLFVTHDQEEALIVSDRIAVMNHGRIEQIGRSSTEIFERPETEFVATFMGATNILEGVSDGKSIRLPNGIPVAPTNGYPAGCKVKFTIRPEKLLLSSDPLPEKVCLPVYIVDELYQGTNTSWLVQHEKQVFTVIQQNNRPMDEQKAFARGEFAYACWDPKITVFLKEK